MRPRHVLVTGGTGFLGREVVRGLAAQGAYVHVLRRPNSPHPAPAGPGLWVHAADLTDDGLERAFESAAADASRAGAALEVVHLAAVISYRRRDRELLWRINVEGTRRVLDAARRAAVRRVCHVSSVAALGPVERADQWLEDDAPLRGDELDSAYAATKAKAEALVLAAAPELDVVVASPAVVFGSSSVASNSQHFLERSARGGFGPISPPGSLTVVGLEDAAHGIVLALERGGRGRRYLLGESTWRLHDLLTLVAQLRRRRAPLVSCPPSAWRALVGAARAVAPVVASQRLTPEALHLLGLHFRFRCHRARSELGWEPRPIEEVLAALLAQLGP